MGHAKESIAERVALGARDNFHGQVAFGNRHGDAGHFLEVGDHVIEGGRQSADFVVAMNVDVLIEVAGIADFASNSDKVSQWLTDGFGSLQSSIDTNAKREEGEK